MIADLSSVDLNEETAYLMEVLKVESYYNSANNTLTLQNKDILFLRRIEEIIKKLEMHISKRLLIKVRLESGLTKNDIEMTSDNHKIKLHIEKSPFDSSKIKAVTSVPYVDNFKFRVTYRNLTKNYTIEITGTEILCSGDGDCWAYKDLRFPNKRIFSFLNKYSSGKDNFSDYLNSANKKMIMAAFSGLIDAEGSINWYGLKRSIRVRMRNESYLKGWCNLLNELEIGCKFSKNKQDWQITIYGWEDFKKLQDYGLKLYNSKKIKEFDEIMSGFKRNQISRGSYKKFYTSQLKNLNRRVTSIEFSKILNKKKRTVNHYLLKLEKEDLLECDRTKEPYMYSISRRH